METPGMLTRATSQTRLDTSSGETKQCTKWVLCMHSNPSRSLRSSCISAFTIHAETSSCKIMTHWQPSYICFNSRSEMQHMAWHAIITLSIGSTKFVKFAFGSLIQTASVCVCESYIGKPIGTRAVPQFTTGVAKPLTQIEPGKN